MGGAVAQAFALARPAGLAGFILIGTGARLRVLARLVDLLRQHPREGQSLIQDLSFGAARRASASGRSTASCARGRRS